MADYERKFTDINASGNSSSFESEIAKIMTRYGNEGRPESLAPHGIDSKKQVRFNEQFR